MESESLTHYGFRCFLLLGSETCFAHCVFSRMFDLHSEGFTVQNDVVRAEFDTRRLFSLYLLKRESFFCAHLKSEFKVNLQAGVPVWKQLWVQCRAGRRSVSIEVITSIETSPVKQ